MRAWEASIPAAVAAIALFSRIARRTASRSESGSWAHRYPENKRKSVFRIGLGLELRSQKPRCGKNAIGDSIRPPRCPRRGGASRSLAAPHHDVAWQQQSEVDFVLESLVGDRRVAGAENHIPREVDPQLFFELCLYIDLTED